MMYDQWPGPVEKFLTPATSLPQHPSPSPGTSVQVPAILLEGRPRAEYKVPTTWAKTLPAKARVSNMILYMANTGEGSNKRVRLHKSRHLYSDSSCAIL